MRENRTPNSLTVDSDPRSDRRRNGRRLWGVGVSFAAAAGVLGAPGAGVAAAADEPQSHESLLDPSFDDSTPPPQPSSSDTAPSTPANAATSSTRDAVVQLATKELGKPYHWGATGANSFDCSGLTTYVYRQAQVQLPRTSQAQFRTGKPVSSNAIQPGDLVFWNTDGTGASHVGIAISPTEAISAGTHDGVRKHPIKQGYWGTHFMGARSEL